MFAKLQKKHKSLSVTMGKSVFLLAVSFGIFGILFNTTYGQLPPVVVNPNVTNSSLNTTNDILAANELLAVPEHACVTQKDEHSAILSLKQVGFGKYLGNPNEKCETFYEDLPWLLGQGYKISTSTDDEIIFTK